LVGDAVEEALRQQIEVRALRDPAVLRFRQARR
jgi:hypothetical protein